jgi:hypothetical protein
MNACHVLVVLVFLGTAADGQQADDLPVETLLAARWEIAPEVSWYRYEEPGVMENTGTLYGVAASYTHRDHPEFWRLEGGVSAGEVEYDGALMDGTPYTMTGNDDLLVRVRILGGRLWQTEGWDNQFYGGLGYRYLNDDSTQDPHGYNRHSNYFYMPLGLRTYHELGDNWYLGLGGEFDVLLFGVQISDIDGRVTNSQWPGFGARASVELRRSDSSLDLAVAPFVQYWWIDESDVSPEGWYEPRNNTLQYGLSLVWRF